MLPLAPAGLAAPAVAGRGLSDGLGLPPQRTQCARCVGTGARRSGNGRLARVAGEPTVRTAAVLPKREARRPESEGVAHRGKRHEDATLADGTSKPRRLGEAYGSPTSLLASKPNVRANPASGGRYCKPGRRRW